MYVCIIYVCMRVCVCVYLYVLHASMLVYVTGNRVISLKEYRWGKV
jgi:hypothetical protein